MHRNAVLPKAAALAVPIMLGTWTVSAADLVETAEQSGRFNDFLYLLKVAGMADTLEGEGPFTVFAPTDEAFEQLSPATLDLLLLEEGQKPLEAVLRAHIVADAAISAGQLLNRAVEVATLGGGSLAIDGVSGVILLAPIEVTITEVEADRLSAATGSVILVEASQDPGANMNRLATFAQQELISAAAVVVPDLEADNGVIHGIDLVLLPPEVLWWF